MVKYLINNKNGVLIKESKIKELILYEQDLIIYDFDNNKSWIFTNDGIVHEFKISKYLVNKIKNYGENYD